MVWVNAIVQGILLGGLYALFATGLSLGVRRHAFRQPRPRRPGDPRRVHGVVDQHRSRASIR